ncbi:hypothetical protein HPB50_014936 [Hyalomma asiaticum]|uniref:Uncharacterized protein n=1 Tax=Hyalomma asiaticum TaxID=266040 RepID=A0ACB7SYS9_HYAAI|nr:hypothetical protein HPB50_014936 [Hyalomma asiaticum]
MMEEVEQDWRQYYDACYERPHAAAGGRMARADGNPVQDPAGLYGEFPTLKASDSVSKLMSSEKSSGFNVFGKKTSTVILRSLVLFVIGVLCLTLLVIIVVNLNSSGRRGSSGDEGSEAPKEVSLHLDAPGLQNTASSRRPAAAPAARSQAKAPGGKHRKPSKQAKSESGKNDGQTVEGKEGTGASEDRQCAVGVLRFTDSRPSRNDLKASYWYREGKRCVEWSYPDGYCATKHRGVARSLRECRDNCLGPGTHDNSCTLPAEYTCPTEEMKFPYFAYTFSNGTVACLLADAEVLRPHRCLVGENKYSSREECRRACSKNTDAKEKKL